MHSLAKPNDRLGDPGCKSFYAEGIMPTLSARFRFFSPLPMTRIRVYSGPSAIAAANCHLRRLDTLAFHSSLNDSICERATSPISHQKAATKNNTKIINSQETKRCMSLKGRICLRMRYDTLMRTEHAKKSNSDPIYGRNWPQLDHTEVPKKGDFGSNIARHIQGSCFFKFNGQSNQRGASSKLFGVPQSNKGQKFACRGCCAYNDSEPGTPREIHSQNVIGRLGYDDSGD
ncbi:hypothetical protein CPB83DRAFT_835149 [Crepidotus variabilis]|uniref:Uncharacterized protein n=1 Tax=Crepidotus variabilis TaxID=179855 RepID=A0A9P6EIJ7_9AGAR|nr:hypothetical protein CPB83DRAFT_835149 [Crepidotus variabilis]